MSERLEITVAASDVANIFGHMGQKHRVLDSTRIERLVLEALAETSGDYRAAVNRRLEAFISMLYGRPDLWPFVTADYDFNFQDAITGAIARCPLRIDGPFHRFDAKEFKRYLLLMAPSEGRA
jgi:hypothetical protein